MRFLAPVLAALLVLVPACLLPCAPANAASVRISGDLLVHLLGDVPPLGGEVTLELQLPRPFSQTEAPRYKVSVRDWRLDLPWLEGVFQGEALLAVHEDSLQLQHFSLKSENAVLRRPGVELPPTPLTLSGQASRNRKDQGWSVTHLTLRMGTALDLQGQASFSAEAGLSATLAGEAPEARALQRLLGPLLPPALRGADATGSLGLACSITPTETKGMRLEATLQPRRLRLWDRSAAGQLEGLARLQLTMAAPPQSLQQSVPMPADWRLEGSLALPGGEKFKGLRLDLALEGDQEAAQIRQCLVRPYAASSSRSMRLLGSLALSQATTLRLEELQLQADGLGAMQGSIVMAPDEMDGSLQGADLKLAGLLAWTDSFWPTPPASWNPSGGLDCTLKLSGAPDTPRLEARLQARGAGFASPDGNILAENLRLEATLEGSFGETPELALTLDAPSGAALYKTIYLDLAAHPASVQLQAALPTRKGGAISLRKLRAGLKGLGLVLASGAITPGEQLGYDIQASASRLELGPLFATFVKEPLSMSSPGLAQAEASGGGGLELHATGSGARAQLRGRLDLVNVGFTTGADGPAVEHMNLELPFDYDTGKSAGAPPAAAPGLNLQWGADTEHAAPGGANTGNLYIGHVRTPLGDLHRLQMPVWLTDNEFGLGGSIALPMFGGSLLLRQIQVQQPLSATFQLSCRARLEGLDFAAMDTGPVPLQGNLAGDLGRVRISRKELRTSGELRGQFFGGALRVFDIGAQQPLTSSRRLLASVRVDRMVLERFSNALNLGTVSGRLNLNLQNLEIAYNEPVAFQMEARSEPVEDVPQKISLKAVNAISVMGTGQGLTGAGVSMFASFFKSFSYEAIGFACDLRNDIFRVRGLINAGGVEYLIKKPSLFGINVINANPDNKISFSDMKKRLERVLHTEDVQVSHLVHTRLETKEALP